MFAPLGANTLQIDTGDPTIENRVQGYRLDEADRVVPTEFYPWWMLGGGDLIGTVEDVYCLNRAIKHKPLLKPETWEQVLTPSPINNKGFGCTVTTWHEKLRITHNGGHRGFRTFHVQLPQEDFDVIILSNAGYGNARQPLLELIYRAFFDEDTESESAMELDYGLR